MPEFLFEWFHSSSADTLQINSNNPADLIRQAQDRARIEEKEEAAEKKDWDDLEERRRRVFEMDEAGNQKEVTDEERGARESVISGASGETEFSDATKEEMNEINSLLFDAEKRVAETRKQEEHDAAELRTLMRTTRQKSLDAMQWNDKITKQIGGFWDRQNEKEAENEDEDDKSLDEETFKKILYEAENSEDVPKQQNAPVVKTTESSPKKKGFFGKFFGGKDSKH
uniref:Uncharacterized protein n=1 Tax=Caenorhabditis japonica TaxID=281687 RepID=A0A8R1HRG5_CAEJA